MEMSAPAVAGIERPTLRIGRTRYPVLLPSIRDPRLHLAAVTISLHVLGQVAFGFRLSIAQILLAVVTAGVLEFAITLQRSRVIMWPASALLTGNGIAFILRVPGTEHGDWWSLHGWWLYVGTAAVAIGSKYLIRFRGRHVFNPSNGALVLTFLLFGPERADPLEFWWAPMSFELALALAIIVVGALGILVRVKLLSVALTFWVAFAVGIGVIALAGHEMTARWHLGSLTGLELWRSIVLSPEILVFLFFMITDPKTVPSGARGRRAYALGVAAIACLLIAPVTTEFWTKVAVLGALVAVCALRVPVELLAGRRQWLPSSRPTRLVLVAVGAAAFVSLLVAAGIPARPGPSEAIAASTLGVPAVTIATRTATDGTAGLDARTGERIAGDLVRDLRLGAAAVRSRSAEQAGRAAGGSWLGGLLRGIRAPGGLVPRYELTAVHLSLERSDGQGPPTVLAAARGRVALVPYGSGAATATPARPFRQTFELSEQAGRYVIVRSRAASIPALATPVVLAPADVAPGASLAGVRLTDVAPAVGLDFRHAAFRFGMSGDTPSMMAGGLCWLDFDNDGWLDLFVTNTYTDDQLGRWYERGGAPRSTLFRNDRGRFVDVSHGSGADLPIRASGCAAADLNGDGRTDLYVSAMGADALLWNTGDGTFVDGAADAGITGWGWHAGVAIGDVNGDQRPDVFVAGYTDPLNTITGSSAGFPTNHPAIADRLFLNLGGDRPRFHEVAKEAGIERGGLEHGLGAVLTDANGDGRLDLFVANDEDPNRLYLNRAVEADPAGLGFRFDERSRVNHVDDGNAGMGIAAGDFTGDAVADLLVTNSRDQLHAAVRGTRAGPSLFTDARPDFGEAFDTRLAGWGTALVDLDLDGRSELVVANGAIPVTSLVKSAQRVQVLANAAPLGAQPRFVDRSSTVGLRATPLRVGRGLAVADFDNDGDPDIAINSVGGKLVLLRTTGRRGHWLEVGFEQFSPGAVVSVTLSDGRRLVREVHAGSSYLSSDDPRLHFGLGSARVRELTVRFPDGRVVRRTDARADRVVTISR